MPDIEELSIEDREKHYFPCWGCDIPVPLLNNQPLLRVFCPDCKEKYEAEKEETLKEYVRLKTLVMHERALRILEKQEAKLFKYKDAAEAVLDFALTDPQKFSSSHEMIAAMELIRHNVKVKVQYKVANHRVDFLIPKFKTVLEIDGYMHKYHKLKDSKRDIKIRQELGEDWEVVRIPTKYIEQNAGALIRAIKELYKFKQQTRRKNNGLMPEWYSDREKTYYEKVLSQEG
mgnify:FL=1